MMKKVRKRVRFDAPVRVKRNGVWGDYFVTKSTVKKMPLGEFLSVVAANGDDLGPEVLVGVEYVGLTFYGEREETPKEVERRESKGAREAARLEAIRRGDIDAAKRRLARAQADLDALVSA